MRCPNDRRILLIEPPFWRLFKDTYSNDRIPLSLSYMAGMILRHTDWNVMVYNADFSPSGETLSYTYFAADGFQRYLRRIGDIEAEIWREVQRVITRFQPTVVGISSRAPNFAAACIVAKLVKQHDHTIPVIIGGHHPSMVKSDVLAYPQFDIAVVGEAENTIVEILQLFEGKRNIADIPGIIHRDGRRVVDNGPRTLMSDLDVLPLPYETAPTVVRNIEQYPPAAWKHIIATRGCPNRCLFCGAREIWGGKVRFRSPENVAQEIQHLQQRGIRAVNFEDDSFGLNSKYLLRLCGTLRALSPKIRWSCKMHIRHVDKQTVSLMKSAGCHAIHLGMESGSNEILRAMRKKSTVDEAQAACEIVKRHGLELHAFFMIGFPHETEDTLRATVEAIKRCGADQVVCTRFMPYPGTEAFAFCKNNDLLGPDYNIALHNHYSPENAFCLNMSKERFKLLAGDIVKMVEKRNNRNRKRRVLSRNTIWRIQELGLRASLKTGLRIMLRGR